MNVTINGVTIHVPVNVEAQGHDAITAFLAMRFAAHGITYPAAGDTGDGTAEVTVTGDDAPTSTTVQSPAAPLLDPAAPTRAPGTTFATDTTHTTE